jgi:hypothetical protein
MHGTITAMAQNPPLNRRGKKRRKRASGDRTATGRVCRKPVDYRAQAAAQPHRQWLPEAHRLSEKAGSVIGCLNLIGRISDHQYEAGRRYSVIVGAYRSIIGCPTAMSGGGRGQGCTGDKNCDPCRCQFLTNRYMRAYEAIPYRKAHMAINRVVVGDELCDTVQLEHLRAGLNALARHFGL